MNQGLEGLSRDCDLSQLRFGGDTARCGAPPERQIGAELIGADQVAGDGGAPSDTLTPPCVIPGLAVDDPREFPQKSSETGWLQAALKPAGALLSTYQKKDPSVS